MTKFAIFYPEGHQDHSESGHPERPERVEVIKQALIASGHWSDADHLEAEQVSSSVLDTIHSKAYLSLLERTSLRGGHLDSDTYVTQASNFLARQAAGGAIAVARSVWRRENDSGFALTRPPGHHATYGQGMGFCLLNNIALAAETLIQEESANRLAIVDLDLHHGNGTQDIFWRRGDVMFLSTHQRPLYPGTGALEERGQGDGFLATANFPMPPGSGDEAFTAVIDKAILPLLHRYRPEMLLISYGFDTHWNDPLGHLYLSAGGYARLISQLRNFALDSCNGRIALFLEGGYDLDAAETCSVCVVNALLGQAWKDQMGPAPYRETVNWRMMLSQAQTLWDLGNN